MKAHLALQRALRDAGALFILIARDLGLALILFALLRLILFGTEQLAELSSRPLEERIVLAFVRTTEFISIAFIGAMAGLQFAIHIAKVFRDLFEETRSKEQKLESKVVATDDA